MKVNLIYNLSTDQQITCGSIIGPIIYIYACDNRFYAKVYVKSDKQGAYIEKY